MVIAFEDEVLPEASPLQPVKTYCTPVPPETVVLGRIAFAVAPESYHPAPLGEA